MWILAPVELFWKFLRFVIREEEKVKNFKSFEPIIQVLNFMNKVFFKQASSKYPALVPWSGSRGRNPTNKL